MNSENLLQLGRQLKSWYWEDGAQRNGEYELGIQDWAQTLYRATELAGIHSEANKPRRPAMAVWGPSQTGKSTLVSRYMDEKAQKDPAAGEIGSGSALHWPGGQPALFFKPASLSEEDAYAKETVILNPFNSGLDASACLTRFVVGQIEGGSGPAFVHTPAFPVTVELVKVEDLWQAIARGYDSQCLGPEPKISDGSGHKPSRLPPIWTVDKFKKAFFKFLEGAPPKNRLVSREAFEHLFSFCNIIDDFLFADVPRYRELKGDTESGWQDIRKSLLSPIVEHPRRGTIPNLLLYDLRAAEDFTAVILWDGYEVLTDYFREMSGKLRRWRDTWGDKPLRCSIEVAALLLDMETYALFLKQPDIPKEQRIHNVVPRIKFEESNSAVHIGLDLGDTFLEDQEDIGVFQGLVWELIVPLNPQNLPDSAFKSFIEVSDLLDFPGVERGGRATEGNRIDLDILADNRRRGNLRSRGEGDSQKNDPFQFFVRILKRGKTSTIVSTYAKRLTIDGFSIFMDLDKDKPNGDELITGTYTWWRNRVPDYFNRHRNLPDPEKRSPLPLNFGMMWWAFSFDERHSMESLKAKYDVLDELSDPRYANVFAMNYYSISRGQMKEETQKQLPDLVDRLRGETAWKKQFRTPLSKESFQAMLDDKVSGGTEFFFDKIREQMLDVQSSWEEQLQSVEDKAVRAAEFLQKLLETEGLLPEEQQVDVRKQHLESFRETFHQVLGSAGEGDYYHINYQLRKVLDIPSSLLDPIPQDPADIDASFIARQFNHWVNLRKSQNPPAFRDTGEVESSWVGIADEKTREQVLRAMVDSLVNEFEDLAKWLADLVRRENVGRTDLRRLLAVSLTNALVFGEGGARVLKESKYQSSKRSEEFQESSRKAFSRMFIEPFAGKDGQLDQLIQRRVRPRSRPDQPGDPTIKSLHETYHEEVAS